jgi:hypothetical protein
LTFRRLKDFDAPTLDNYIDPEVLAKLKKSGIRPIQGSGMKKPPKGSSSHVERIQMMK